MSCINPRQILRKDGTYMSVSCGHCVGCANAKAKRNTTLCHAENAKHKFCYFITLTYAPEFLPIAQIHHSVHSFDSYYDEFAFTSPTERVNKYYKSDLIDFYELKYNQHYSLNLFLKPFNSNKFNLQKNHFGFLYKKDLQDFLKRLRYYINCDFHGEKETLLRYFAVGEYGPKTFRPHYHLECWFDSEALAQRFKDYVSKAWKFGRIDCQLSTGDDSSRYVAGYVNSTVCVPPVLTLPWNRPFFLHSAHFGTSPDEAYYQNLEDLEYRKVNGRGISVSGKYKSVGVSASLQAALFPRCYRYGHSDDLLNIERYKFYSTLLRIAPKSRQKSVTSLCEWYCEKKPQINGFEWYEMFECSDELQSSVLTQLYQSKKFLGLCEKYRTSEWYYYHRVIKPYYKDKELALLNDSYKSFEKQQVEYPELPIYSILRFDNIPKMPWKDFVFKAIHDDEFGYYMKLITDYSHSIGVKAKYVYRQLLHPEESKYIQYNHELMSKIANDNIKHKVLNDLNKIFIYNE